MSASRGVLRDITERKRADEEIARLASIVESSDDAIYSTSLAGEITSWNAAAQKLFGYAAAEIIGKSVLTLISQDRRDEVIQVLDRLWLEEHVTHFETIGRRKGGRRVHVSLSVSPIRNRGRGPGGGRR